MSSPRATVRLQFRHEFTFDDATALVPYFATLGISHVYASPVLTARNGSPHGYDVIDHARVNPELGGEDALQRMVAALRANGMGLIVDIVPNHMAVGGSDNAWWLSVLEWGMQSPFARFFDIDWQASDPTIRGKVLAPVLGKPYAASLRDGDISLRFDPVDGRFFAASFHHRFPIKPACYGALLRDHGSFRDLAASFGDAAASRRYTEAFSDLRRSLAERAVTADGMTAIETLLRVHDASAGAAGRQRLHDLLEQQNYRLSWWRLAADRINWRRFFDVNDLAALQADRPAVFEATHALILRMYADGLIDGVRVDHVDGLADPEAYCRRLRRSLQARIPQRPATAPSGPPYLIVEKILAPNEGLRTSWRVDGTTGYEFMSQVSALQHDPAGEAPLSSLWGTLSGGRTNFDDEAHAAKPEILQRSFGGEFEATFAALAHLAGSDPDWRDTLSDSLRRALTAFLVHLPVYRLYGIADLDAADRAVLAKTIRVTRRTLSALDRRGLRFIARTLSRRSDEALRAAQRQAVLRVHKLSAPLTAKAVEDTAFYRYGRLLSRNEVGASPAAFALSPEGFHVACQQRQAAFPQTMLATATHDHKRGEDVRARLAVLSEVPAAWADAVRHWIGANAALRVPTGDSWAPAPSDEVMLYQMMAGAWPLGLRPDDMPALKAFADRLAGWQQKALREAKQHTAWQMPNQAYEDACRQFLAKALLENGMFRHSLHGFVERIAAAGAVNGLAQTLLRLTAPGVPDLYQGTELWDFSLVDPDNRRPVDFAVRQEILACGMSAEPLADWHSGRVKLHLIARALDLRRRQPLVFARGGYTPIHAGGAAAPHIIGFERRHGDTSILVLATRLPLGLQVTMSVPLVQPETWQDARVRLTQPNACTTWRNVLTGATSRSEDGCLALQDILATLPVALLERMTDSH